LPTEAGVEQKIVKPANGRVASLPAVIFQFALSPYADWQKLAWTGALIITSAVLTLSIVARTLAVSRKSS
jgi:phosphate transport system permease protein